MSRERSLKSIDRPQKTRELLGQLLGMMQPGESVVRSFKRIGGGGVGNYSTSTTRIKYSKNKRKTPLLSEQELIKIKEQRQQVEQMTGIVDQLLDLGVSDMYELTYTQLLVKLELMEGSKKYRYKWTETGQVFGPYTSQQMTEWQKKGYFEQAGLWLETSSDLHFEWCEGFRP